MLSKEKDLELLIRELDDKVRFGQKSFERPGSGAGRVAGLPERPPSQSGLSDDYRSGTADVWSRPGDDRRAFQGGRERGFLSNRDIDRPKSRGRW
ncbi:eukaryotic translation initiation factor 4B2-like [Macadamia integrifolia]|nr:eukaryotic translation initiation factor 4B2-like [Macadamia integrifolia]